MKDTEGNQPHEDAPSYSWLSEIVLDYHAGRKARAFRALDGIITGLPLFSVDPAHATERRVALWLKTYLLQQTGRDLEAAAWLCLSCTVHPKDKAMQAQRDYRLSLLGWYPCSASAGFSKVAAAKFGAAEDWGGVHGMHLLKMRLEEEVIGPFLSPEIFIEYGISPPNGLLLHGPPGCGKSYFARGLARRLKTEFIEVKPGDLASPYVHGTQGKIADLFKRAEKAAPCLIFFDEFDAIAPNRGEKSVGYHYSTEVNELLARLDQCGKQRILVIAATNRLASIDPAVLRPGRFDTKVEIGPPDHASRLAFLQNRLGSTKYDPDLDLEAYALKLDGLTFADLELLCTRAATRALKGREPIGKTHLDHALSKILKSP